MPKNIIERDFPDHEVHSKNRQAWKYIKEPRVTKELKPLTHDDVLRLKAMGRHDDAQELIKTFRKNCTENKKQLQKEIRQQQHKVKRFMEEKE